MATLDDENRHGAARPRWRTLLPQLVAGALLVGATLAAYAPAVRGPFIFDDNLHLLNNPVLQPGGLLRTWLPPIQIAYWPLTFSTYWLEYQMWGLRPAGFHLANILLHAVCALLVWRLLTLLCFPKAGASTPAEGGSRASPWVVPGTRGAAFLAAVIFALHPGNSESVAWISQLKTILCLFFALVCLLLHLRFEARGDWWCYALALVAFALSALAKGGALTLPGVLLLLAWWRRGEVMRRDLWRTAPFVLIAGLMAGIEVWMQHEGALGKVLRSDGPAARVGAAGCCVWFYIGKLLWPVNLSVVYPRWAVESPSALTYMPGVLLLLIAGLTWWRRRRWGRPVLMALGTYVTLLLPVLGFVTITFMENSLVADHWQYPATVAGMALLGVAGAALARGRPRFTTRNSAATPESRAGASTLSGVANGWGIRAWWISAAGTAIILGLLAAQRARLFRDDDKLWRDVLLKNADCAMANYNLGYTLAGRGRPREAMVYLGRAEELRPDVVRIHLNLGTALLEARRPRQAAEEYAWAVRLDADVAQSDSALATEFNNVAWLLATRAPEDGGNAVLGVTLAEAACKAMVGRDTGFLDTLAAAYAAAGKLQPAIAVAERARTLAVSAGQTSLAQAIEARLALYRAGKPCREGPPLPP